MPIKNEGPIDLVRIPVQEVDINIVGTSELIVHRWSEKAKAMMLSKQTNPGTRTKKDAKDPKDDYEQSLYRLPDKSFGFPATAFKAAMVGACRLFEGLPMTKAKTCLFVAGIGPEMLVPLIGEPYMREDMVRLQTGVADIRYRGAFWPWSTTLRIRYNPQEITLGSVFALVDAAGLGGVGEWRPSAPSSSTGSFGMFRVAGEDEKPAPKRRGRSV